MRCERQRYCGKNILASYAFLTVIPDNYLDAAHIRCKILVPEMHPEVRRLSGSHNRCRRRAHTIANISIPLRIPEENHGQDNSNDARYRSY